MWRLLLVVSLLALARSEEDMDAEGADEADDGIEQDALTSEQMRSMHKLFDSDKNGKASMQEVMTYAQGLRLEIARKDIHTILEEMDTSRDNRLSLEELLKDIDAQSDGADEEEMKEMANRKALEQAKFKAADKNGDGELDLEELPALFYPETHAGVLTLTAEATLKQKDSDGDGKLTMKEFWEGDSIDGEDSSMSDEEQEDFKKLDKNSDSFLDLEELKAWESGHFHTEEALKKMFDVADTDGDMHVTADELDNAREQIAGSDAQYHLMEWAEHHEL